MARTYNFGDDPLKPIIKGDTTNYVLFNFLVDGSPIDIASARMHIKKKAKDTAVVFSPALTVGVSSVTVEEQEYTFAAGEYVHDIELTLTNGKIKTYVEGTFTLTQDVTS
jgi:hypothetical protein